MKLGLRAAAILQVKLEANEESKNAKAPSIFEICANQYEERFPRPEEKSKHLTFTSLAV